MGLLRFMRDRWGAKCGICGEPLYKKKYLNWVYVHLDCLLEMLVQKINEEKKLFER